MLLRDVDYLCPASLDDAVAALTAIPGSRVLAGGQSLLNVLKHRIVEVSALIDLSQLEELTRLEVHADGSVTVGAMTTYAAIAASRSLRASQPLVVDVASQLADVQVRNRGTIGGNVCFADPTSNFPPVLVALGASMTIQGKAGPRTVAAADFFKDIYRTDVGEGEVLTAIHLPKAPAGSGTAWRSLRVAPESWGIVNAAAHVVLAGDRIEKAAVVLGCVGPTPVPFPMTEALAGARPGRPAIQEAARRAAAGLHPPADAHASSAYRKEMAAVFAVRALEAATRAAGGEVA